MERLAVRVSEFAEMIGVSRSKGYEVVAAHPELAVRIGGSKRVLVERAREWLARQSENSEVA
jgi:uncharacterized protein YaiE (UPF0345 family)